MSDEVPETPSWVSRLIPLGLIGAGLAISALLLATEPEAERHEIVEPIRQVAVEPVAFDRHQLRVTAHGTVEPRRQIQLVSEVEGTVAWLSPAFVAGGAFASGDLLLRLQDVDHADRLLETEAEVALALAEARKADADLKREQELAQRQIASASRLVDIQTRRDVAHARLKRARALHARAERDLARTRIEAPFDGRIRAKYVDLGQFVAPGAELAQIFASDVAEVRLPVSTGLLDDLEIPSVAIAGAVLENGPAVSLAGRIGDEVHRWNARIARVEAALDHRDRTAILVARLDDPYGLGLSPSGLPLLVGLFVEANIEGRVLERVVHLPREAFIDSRVGIVEGDRLRLRNVEIAAWEDDMAVVHAGLDAGEQVVLDLPAGTYDDMKVTANNEPAAVAHSEWRP